jgi:phosphoribosyl-AMP cyclohydrolase / phosphoribosyl-ATP pyrophosphohydrolase
MKLNFDKSGGILPAIIQDIRTKRVLMLGFMNEEALKKSESSGVVTLYSRTKKRLWTKGEENGHYLDIKEIIEDCDKDAVLIKVVPRGPVCHTGKDSCFNEKDEEGVSFLEVLQDLIEKRKLEMPENSYTTELFKSGINKIAQKVGEEAVELIIESKDNNDELFLNEAADLLYHLLVLFTLKNYRIEDVAKVLKARHK